MPTSTEIYVTLSVRRQLRLALRALKEWQEAHDQWCELGDEEAAEFEFPDHHDTIRELERLQ